MKTALMTLVILMSLNLKAQWKSEFKGKFTQVGILTNDSNSYDKMIQSCLRSSYIITHSESSKLLITDKKKVVMNMYSQLNFSFSKTDSGYFVICTPRTVTEMPRGSLMGSEVYDKFSYGSNKLWNELNSLLGVIEGKKYFLK